LRQENKHTLLVVKNTAPVKNVQEDMIQNAILQQAPVANAILRMQWTTKDGFVPGMEDRYSPLENIQDVKDYAKMMEGV